MSSMAAILFILATAVVILVLFIIFSEVSFLGMLFCTVGCIIFGFYLNYDIRRMVTPHPANPRSKVMSSTIGRRTKSVGPSASGAKSPSSSADLLSFWEECSRKTSTNPSKIVLARSACPPASHLQERTLPRA